MQLCPNCGEENPAKFRLCGFCGTPLAPAVPAQEVRKLVTILFCDLKGSTSLGEQLDSESLRETMSRYFDAMSAAITRHGGTIEKYIGDAVMAVFGLPRVHEDDALRAVRAAREMQEALAGLNEGLQRTYGITLENRTGVNTGEVVAGDSTTGQRLVTGDPVNTAARLEQAAPRLRGAARRADVPARPRSRRGRGRRAAGAEGEGGARSRIPAAGRCTTGGPTDARARRSSGASDETEQIAGALESRHRQPAPARVCSITGDAGVGKSRLVEHVCAGGRRASARHPRAAAFRTATGSRSGRSSRRCGKASGIEDGDDLAGRAREARPCSWARGTRRSSSGSPPPSASRSGSTRFLRCSGRRASSSRRCRARRPLVLVFEDSTGPSRRCSTSSTTLRRRRRTRRRFSSALHGRRFSRSARTWEQLEHLALAPLSADASAQIIDNLLGGADIAADALARIVEAAEGNPLFVEQLLSMMIDGGLLPRRGRRLAAQASSTPDGCRRRSRRS